MTGGEYRCRVCGLRQSKAIWGHDGRCPTYDICDCCGCAFGYEDSSIEGIRRHQDRWLASNGAWFDAAARPSDWNREQQLTLVPGFYLRVLRGLPGTRPQAAPFSATGTRAHAEGFVVEFTLGTSEKWVGNFQPGFGGVSLAFSDPDDAAHAIVVSGGQGFIVEAKTRALVRCFGDMVSDVLFLPDQGVLILGNGLWFERVAQGQTRWKSRRVSWDGMSDLRVVDSKVGGQAYNPIDDHWVPFEVDMETGEVQGGSYPVELR